MKSPKKMSRVLLWGAVVLLVIYPLVSTAATDWDLDRDFRVSPNQANPNPDISGTPNVWHFMQSASLVRDPASYSLLPHFTANAYSGPGLNLWASSQVSHGQQFSYPAVGINASGQNQFAISFTWPAGAVYMVPDPLRLAVVGWRSPITGKVDVTGSFTDLDSSCGNGVAWFVDRGTTNLAQGSFPNGGSQSFNLSDVTITQGNFLYFILDATNNNNICDNIRFDPESSVKSDGFTVSGP